MPELYGLRSRRTDRRLLLRHRLSLVPTSAGNIRAQPEFIGVRWLDRRRDSLVAGERPLFQPEWSARLGAAYALQLFCLQRGGPACADLDRRSKAEASGCRRCPIWNLGPCFRTSSLIV